MSQRFNMNDGNHRVLVVEDDWEINDLVGAYVSIAGFDPVPAHTGAEALRQARAQCPAAVVLDVMLPDVDGFEVCRQLRNEAFTSHVPIIMLTALSGEEDRRRGERCGATCYMTKPFDPERLIDTVRRAVANGGGVEGGKSGEGSKGAEE
jgi:DNA-binding response OmpR family regulator